MKQQPVSGLRRISGFTGRQNARKTCHDLESSAGAGQPSAGALQQALEDGIFEVRGKVGSDISRVLYFFYYGGRIILTNGFIKKTQKTPRNELEKAKLCRKDFMERFGE